jgi:hypothetical protein
MMMLWAWAGVPLGVYNIVEDFNVALRIQPQILTTLSLITWIQCLYYEKNWSISRALAVVCPIAAIMGGIEAALIFALRVGRTRHVEWPVTLMAALSAALLGLGVLTHYWDIYKHRTVRGISFLFVFIDALGDLTSLISVVFQPELDVLGLVIYGTELVLWLGVFACGGYFNLLPWLRIRTGAKGLGTWSCRRAPDGSPQGIQGEQHEVALHNMPSSTSVFRTASGELRARNASGQNEADGIDE